MSYGNLIVDNGGLPIPQTVGQENNTFVPLYSIGGSLKVVDSTLQNGIRQVMLMDATGAKVPVSNLGIPVTVSDKSTNPQEYNGASWINFSQNKVISLLPTTAITGGNFTSASIWNNCSKNAIIAVNIATGSTNKIVKVTIQIEVNGNYMDYKSFTVDWGAGLHFLNILPSTDFVLPAKFRVSFTHTNGVTLSYEASIQLC